MFGISSKSNNQQSESISVNTIIEKNNKQYNLKFFEENKYLVIEAITNDYFPISYTGKYSLKDIKKVKFFTDDYISISEVLSEISETINKKNLNISEKSNEIIIGIPLPSKKYPELIFSLQILKNDFQKLEDTSKKLIKMNEEQKYLKNENLKVQKEMEKIKKIQIKDIEDQDMIKKEQEKFKKDLNNLIAIQEKMKQEEEKLKNEQIKDETDQQKIKNEQEKMIQEFSNLKDEMKKKFENIKNEQIKDETQKIRNEQEKMIQEFSNLKDEMKKEFENIKNSQIKDETDQQKIINEQEKMIQEFSNLKDEMKKEFENIKNEKEKKIYFLEERIKYLENILMIKKNQEVINLENKGIYIECNTFDINNYNNYVFSKDEESLKEKNGITLSFSFFCDKRDISSIKEIMQLLIKDFSDKFEIKEDNNISIYSTEDKIFIDFNLVDIFGNEPIPYLMIFITYLFSNLKVKLVTNFLPINLFEKYDKVKIFKYFLDSKLLFNELSFITVILFLLGNLLFCDLFKEWLKLYIDLIWNELKGNLSYCL